MRKRLRGKLLTVGLILAILGLLGGAATWSAFSATTSNASDKIDSGTVSLTDNDANGAMFSLTGLGPNDTATRCIKATYNGSLASAVRLYGTTTGGNGLGSYVGLTVTRGTYSSDPGFSSCTNFVADSSTYVTGQPAGVVYAGTLANYPTTYAGGIQDVGSGASQKWTSNESHVYKFQITIGDNITAQGKSVTQRFTWEAQNDTGYRGTVLSTSGLQSYWRLGEASGTTASDQKGSVSGTYAGTFTLGQTGAISGDSDKATSFDGVSGRMSFGDNYAFAGTVPFSVEAWLNQSAAHTSLVTRVMEKVNYGASRDGWLVAVQANDVPEFIRYNGSGTSGTVVTTGSFTTAASTGWHHLVATYDGTNMRLYLDGVLRGGPSGSAYAMNAQTAPLVAAQASASGNNFPGLLDELAIYNVALTAAQVDDHYHRGRGG